jgi:hypothetical protein
MEFTSTRAFAVVDSPAFRPWPPSGVKPDPLNEVSAVRGDVTLRLDAHLWPFSRDHYFAIDCEQSGCRSARHEIAYTFQNGQDFDKTSRFESKDQAVDTARRSRVFNAVRRENRVLPSTSHLAHGLQL